MLLMLLVLSIATAITIGWALERLSDWLHELADRRALERRLPRHLRGLSKASRARLVDIAVACNLASEDTRLPAPALRRMIWREFDRKEVGPWNSGS